MILKLKVSAGIKKYFVCTMRQDDADVFEMFFYIICEFYMYMAQDNKVN